MVDVYEIPDPFITSNNIPIPATEALCIMLRRLAVSSRLLEMNDVFGRPPEALSRVFNEMVIWFTTRWGGLLTWDPVLLAPEKLEEYCNAVTSRSGRMGVVWGFIDGTVRQICRPSQWQDVSSASLLPFLPFLPSFPLKAHRFFLSLFFFFRSCTTGTNVGMG